MKMKREADGARELVALAHEFAEREMRPLASHYDETESFPWEVFLKAAQVGFTAYDLPAEYGGGGIDSLLASCLVIEELAWGDSPMVGCITGGSFFAGPLIALGSEEQKARWIPQLCSREPAVAALAITEPHCGSDIAAIQTYARRVDNGYILNGTKTWISNAPVADLYLVYATVAPGTGWRGITPFIVERGDSGLNLGRQIPKLGARCYPAAELSFDECFVSNDRRLGGEGAAFFGLMRWLDWSRVQLAANSLGIARAALEYAIEYAKHRTAFDQPIHSYQAVSFRLVDVHLAVTQARLLTHHAAMLADSGKTFGTEAAMSKIAASEAAWFAAWACCQTLGGYGYSREYPAERWLRNAKLEEIYEGTNDIQRLIVASRLFT